MRKIIIAISILIALLAISILVLPSLIPSSVYKSTIEQQISAKLGRNVKIDGDVRLSVFPALSANAGQVTVANADGFSGAPFIAMESLQAKVKLLPLLKKQVEITEFTLISPKISLEKLKNGHVNWNFGTQKPDMASQAPEQTSAFKRDGRYADLQISLGIFTLKDGQINYQDAQKNTTHTLKSVNAKLAMLGMETPVTAKGDLIFNTIPMDIDLRLETPKSFLNGQASPIFIQLKSNLVTMLADGKFTASQDLTFDIDFDADIPSVSKLDKLLGIKNPYGPLSERAKLKAALSFDGTNLVAKNAVLSLGSSILTTNFSGDFTAGPKPSAAGNLAINISDLFKLQDTLGFNYPQTAMLRSVQFSTKLTTNGVITNGQNTALTLKGDLIDASYKGNAKFDNALSLDGNFTAASPSFKALTTKLGMKDIQGADIIGNFNARGRIGGLIDKLSLSEVDFKSHSEQLGTTYLGAVQLSKPTTLNGNFTAKSPSVQNLFGALAITTSPYINAVGNLDVTGKLSGPINALTLTTLNAKTKGEFLTAKYEGAIDLAKPMKLSGRFDTFMPSVSNLVATLGMESTPYLKTVGDLNLTGQISGPINAPTLTTLNAKTKGEFLTASYLGDVNLAKPIALNGRFESFIPSVKNFAQQSNLKNPYAEAIGTLTASGIISGAPDAFSLSNLSTNLNQGLLNMQFDGQAKTGKVFSYDGKLSADTASLRQLAALGGTNLPASTAQGEVYGTFSIDGQVTGNPKNINFTNAQINMDNLMGTGSFRANINASKPMLNSTLDLNGLDLRPYMAAQNPSGKIQPWKEEALNLSAFKLFNADFTLNTPNILVGRLDLGQSNIKALVKNGILTTHIPNVSLYGGRGDLDMTINGNSPITKVAVDFTLKDVDGKGFLGAAAGFTKLTGNTGTTMKFRGSGRSQAEIMRSLNGDGSFELAEGIIAGVDIAQFVGGIDSALQTRTLPAGIGSQYTTPFDKLAGLFTVTNGVLTVGDFNINSKTIRADGSGTIDIGKQMIDFSLQPRLKEAKGLAGFGIPIRFSGGFGNVSAGLDTGLLGNIVAARAKAKLQNEITKNIGGGLGNVLGGVLGTGRGTPTPAQTSPISQTQPQAPKPSPTPEDMLGGILGEILGTPAPEPEQQNKPKEPQKEEPKEEEKKQEDPLEKALKDLFGGG